jgi:3'(2'), 5'-bisphosphate nucleotidase
MGQLEFDRLGKEVKFAIRVVSEASLLVKTIQTESGISALSKQDRSPVTIADFASQALISKRMLDEFPQDILVAEEDAEELRSDENSTLLTQVTEFVTHHVSDATPELVCQWVDHGGGAPGVRFWTLDPIDGTKGFLRGDQYVVALALIEYGKVVMGALGCPHLGKDLTPDRNEQGSTVISVRENGTWSRSLEGGDFKRVEVSTVAAPEKAQLLLSVESAHTDLGKMNAVREALGNHQDPVRMDSQAKLAVLAGGGADLIFRLLSPSKLTYKEKIWDQAAGSLIVEEAGGRVTDLRGEPLDFSVGSELIRNTGVVVSNGLLHEAALEALKAADVLAPS